MSCNIPIWNPSEFSGPDHISLKALFARFLNEFLFVEEKVPVSFSYTRESISLPVCCVISHDFDRYTVPIGFDFGASPGDYEERSPTPSLSRGAQAKGNVEIEVVADNPDDRDRFFAKLMAGLFSYRGQCWLACQSDGVLESFVPVMRTENNYRNRDITQSDVSQLFSQAITLDVTWRVTCVEALDWITDVQDFPQVVIDY